MILDILLDSWCRFAVKSGGHARYPDDSVSVGGVTIDMRRMRSIEVSPDRSTVRLGSGHVLHSMYAGLEAYNLTALGGRVADVGLGGFVLGGGFSNLSPKYGLAMDNVLEYEVCTSLQRLQSVCRIHPTDSMVVTKKARLTQRHGCNCQ